MSQSFPADEAAPADQNVREQSKPSEQELVTTLFDLGRQVTGVLDFDDLLHQIPRLIGRLISFEAFAVYLLDERRGELRVAYAVGYPPAEQPIRLRPGMGPVGDFKNDVGKVFASFYALFSGLVFITIAGIIVAPVAHRLLNWFHVEEETRRQKAKGKNRI